MKPALLLSVAVVPACLAFSSCAVPVEGTVYSTSRVYQPGYTVSRLPSGYSTQVISGTRYYTHGGVYYVPRGRSYVVVEQPRHGSRHDYHDHDGDGIPARYDHNDYRVRQSPREVRYVR